MAVSIFGAKGRIDIVKRMPTVSGAGRDHYSRLWLADEKKLCSLVPIPSQASP